MVDVDPAGPPTPSLSSSTGTSQFGQQVTLTATMTKNGEALAGSILFKLGNQILATVPLATNYSASFTTIVLPPGNDTLTAVFQDLSDNMSAPSAASSILVAALTPTVSMGVLTPGLPTLPPTFGVSVVPYNGITATGVVDFFEGSTLLGSATLFNGSTVFTPAMALSQGMHTIVAHYEGGGPYGSGDSAEVAAGY